MAKNFSWGFHPALLSYRERYYTGYWDRTPFDRFLADVAFPLSFLLQATMRIIFWPVEKLIELYADLKIVKVALKGFYGVLVIVWLLLLAGVVTPQMLRAWL